MGIKGTVKQAALRTPARSWLLTEPEFVIVGTGRSGTGYIARVLTESGVKTGHEHWWNPTMERRTVRLVGDASWLAVFNLDGYQGRIFHQVRNPIDTVASLAAFDVNSDWQTAESRPYYDFRNRHVTLSGEPIPDAMHVCLAYLNECERIAETTWRVEDVDEETVEQVGQALNRSVAPTISANRVNVRPHNTLTWDDLPEGPTKRRLLEHAQKWGYIT